MTEKNRTIEELERYLDELGWTREDLAQNLLIEPSSMYKWDDRGVPFRVIKYLSASSALRRVEAIYEKAKG